MKYFQKYLIYEKIKNMQFVHLFQFRLYSIFYLIKLEILNRNFN